jgi:hypothetical protein
VKHKHLNLEKNGFVEEDMKPYFLYESIILEKIDDNSTSFTLIEVFPSFGMETKDKFNIIRKHVGRKKRIKINLENSKFNTFDDIQKDDPLGKLLHNSINNN